MPVKWESNLDTWCAKLISASFTVLSNRIGFPYPLKQSDIIVAWLYCIMLLVTLCDPPWRTKWAVISLTMLLLHLVQWGIITRLCRNLVLLLQHRIKLIHSKLFIKRRETQSASCPEQLYTSSHVPKPPGSPVTMVTGGPSTLFSKRNVNLFSPFFLVPLGHGLWHRAFKILSFPTVSSTGDGHLKLKDGFFCSKNLRFFWGRVYLKFLLASWWMVIYKRNMSF